MSEPPAKKQKTEEEVAGKGSDDVEDAKEESEAATKKEEEPKGPTELEEDAPVDKGQKLKEPLVFHVPDTTMNVMPSSFGNMLMPLSDGGLQYLLASARTSVGMKSGRYMFEVKIVEYVNPAEDPQSKARIQGPRNYLRVGVSVAGSELILGETEDNVCFDSEGFFIHDKQKKKLASKAERTDVLAVLVNLDAKSPNANTISLFKNGVRVSQPQALPDSLKGKPLFPTMTWKNMTLHYNFGPSPLVALPFKCTMIGTANVKDTIVTPKPEAKDGKYEVLFPMCLPDEGIFDWLDSFLQKHGNYTELSDRTILGWAEKSGLWRPKGFKQYSCKDKPEMQFGIQFMDDLSIRRILQAVAPVQQRNYIVMEVKSNLLKDDRKEFLTRFSVPGYKKVAIIMMGEPSAEFKKKQHELMLAAKQEASDAEFKAKKAEEKKKKDAEKKKKDLEKQKKKAEKAKAKAEAERKKKLEIEKKKKEAQEKGEEYVEEPEEPAPEEEEEPEEEEAEVEEMDEDPPKVELTPEEKKSFFRKHTIPDLTSYVLNTSFQKFSLPDKDEGFDDLKYEWLKGAKCTEYLKDWILKRKLTTRIEELTPSEWFNGKWKEWQKALQQWHQKQNEWKAAVGKKAAEKTAKAAKKAAKKAEAQKKIAAAKAAGEEVKEDEMEVDDEEEPEEEEKVDFDKLDVFGVEDILDIGFGEPLFSNFAFEDWTMMSLRFELHLLAHAFRHDVNDPDRIGIHPDHLMFYYNKYYKKALNVKFYGVETIQDVLKMVSDTVVLDPKGNVMISQLPAEMESSGVFAMITEESRRNRQRKVDMGDESAALKLQTPQTAMMAAQAAAAAAKASGGVIRPAGPQTPTLTPQAPAVAKPQQQWWPGQAGQVRAPGAPFNAGFRPPFGVQPRPFAQMGWRPGGW